jgi:hypothetical protein
MAADQPKQLPEIDPQQLIRHFQGINSAIVTNTVNMLLTLSVALVAFGVNIIINAKNPLNTAARNWLVAGVILLFLSTLAAILIQYTRIEDYRRTIVGAVMIKDNLMKDNLDPAVKNKAAKVKKQENFSIAQQTSCSLSCRYAFFSASYASASPCGGTLDDALPVTLS